MLFAAFGTASRGGEQGPRLFFLLLLLLLLGFIASRIIRRRRGHLPYAGGAASAISTLRDRFARGDISQAEFEHRKAVLDGADVVPPAPVTTVPPDASPDSAGGAPSDEGDQE